MSYLGHWMPRTTMGIIRTSRMNAHSTPPGTPAKASGGGGSSSVLPGGQTASDKTNPTKTASDSKPDPDKAHQSIFKSPAGQLGVAAVALLSIYGAYKMLLGNSPDQKANFRTKQDLITRPDLAGESEVHARLAEEHHSKKPRETVNPSTTTKAH